MVNSLRIKNLEFKFYSLRGEEARPYFSSMAKLRIEIFRYYPYLYEGTESDESLYLETYFKAKDSFILLVKYENNFVGMTSCIRASEEETNFQIPFNNIGLDPNQILYLGESVLLEKFRGLGIGKMYFQEREKFGLSIGIQQFAFCSVLLPENHHLRPKDYQDLSNFWKLRGYFPREDLITRYDWTDKGNTHKTTKLMQYWMKVVN